MGFYFFTKEENVMFYFTGVQHTKSGDTVIPVAGYEKRDGYLKKFHEEMAYALNNTDFIGLDILVFDNSANAVLKESWVKEVEIVEPAGE